MGNGFPMDLDHISDDFFPSRAMESHGLLKDSNLKISCLDADEASDVALAVEVGLAALDTHQEEERNEPWSLIRILIMVINIWLITLVVINNGY